MPGLAAKPIIDIQVSVSDVEDAAAYRDAFEAQGFVSRMMEPGHHYFRPPRGVPRDYQVHVCTIGSDWEWRHLLFRDYLRADPETRAGYLMLKRELATQFTHDRIGYNDAKVPFIEAAVERAEEWAKLRGWKP